VLLATPDYRVRGVPLDHGGIPSVAYALQETLHVAIHKDALDAAGYRPGPWLTRFKERVRRGAPGKSALAVPLAGGGEKWLSLEELEATIAHTERGMKIVYVTDATPSAENLEKIVELAAEAHLLAIEATFADQDKDRAQQRNHLTARLAGELARRAGVARLLVFHHSPRYQEQPQRLAEEAQRAFRGEPP
jgi:ribonuclease Z